MKPWEGMLIVQRSPGNKPCTPAYRSRKTEDITAKENEQDSQVEREPRHSHIREASGAGGGGPLSQILMTGRLRWGPE